MLRGYEVIDDDGFDDEGSYNVDVHSVLTSKNHLSVTKLLAANLAAEPYFTVKSFLVGLSDQDLNLLLDIAETAYQEKPHQYFSDLVLISEMLAEAEGLDGGDLETYRDRLATFMGFIAIERLDRDGLVKAHRENMSFGDDTAGRIVVERIAE